MSADDTIARWLAGAISPEVALARLVLAGVSPDEIARRLDARLASRQPTRAQTGDLARLLTERRDGIDRLARMVTASGLDHGFAAAAGPDAALERVRAAFDSAVACSPEASVAAYSLGDPEILDAATAELVDWLTAEGLIGPECDVLDLGCGIGRVAAALAPRCRSVLGIDISPGMIAEARRRHTCPNVRFAVTDGRELPAAVQIDSEPSNCIGAKLGHDGMSGDAYPLRASFDLVLAVDSFPYLMQAGLGVAERHVSDAARCMRKGGALAILNLSYRGGLAADRADAARWASLFGWRLARNGETPFALWDGAVFVLRGETGD